MSVGGIRPGSGRPKGPETKTISVRVPVDDASTWLAAAALSGQRISDWLRDAANAAARIQLALRGGK